jgi:GT2 family glycosyltransferase
VGCTQPSRGSLDLEGEPGKVIARYRQMLAGETAAPPKPEGAPTVRGPASAKGAGGTPARSPVTSRVAVCIVTYNSERYLRRCLEALDSQTRRPADVLVWDNASTDQSVALAEKLSVSVVRAPENVGFARAANELIRRTTTPYVLLLNPDAYLRPRYVELLERAADADPRIGSVTGKLIRPTRHGEIPVLDSTGHVLYRNRVAVNRGENEPDRGQHDTAGEVFGVCAAAALYRRAMLEDVRVGMDYFDSTFFAYLEDADLDWRARLRGWMAYYVPGAVAEHERGHKGDRRRQSTLEIRHSLKNRYLMMVRNDRPADVLPDLGAILVTEMLRFLDYGVGHPAALSGYILALRLLPSAVAARRQIQARRLVDGPALRGWLQPYPFAGNLRRRLRRAPAVSQSA